MSLLYHSNVFPTHHVLHVNTFFFNVLAGRVRYVLLLKGNVGYCNVYILNAHYVSTCCYCSIFVISPFLCSRGNRGLFPLSFE